jgi:PCFT/HCP family folate transporter-like MFS transporter 1/3
MIASKLMEIDPWIPLLLAMGFFILGAVMTCFLPETLHRKADEPAGTTPDQMSINEESRRPAQPEDSSFISSLKYELQVLYFRIYESTMVLHSWPIFLLLITFFIRPITEQTIDFAPQYISKRFGWTLARAGYLLSVRALVNIFLVLVFLPLLSNMLISSQFSFQFTPQEKDLFLARTSTLFLVSGSFLTAGPTIGIAVLGFITYTLGVGFPSLTRSLLSTLVDSHHVARVYGAAGVAETIGSLTAGPGIPILWKLGLKWKGAWLGLPYLGATLVCGICALAVWCFRVPKDRVSKPGSGSDGQREDQNSAL